MQKAQTSCETERESSVVPESTIESANRKQLPASTLKQLKDNRGCESKIDSSLRRDFIKRAAIATAAVGIGGAFLGKNFVPESSATSIGVFCTVEIGDCAVVDTASANSGKYCAKLGSGHVLSFGAPFCSAGVKVINGEAIGSARVLGSPNRFGLDFYTGYTKRVSITSAGKVGIGTCVPAYTLCVRGASTGVFAFGKCNGVFGSSPCNVGVYGTGYYFGVAGTGTSPKGIGVQGCSKCSIGVRGFGKYTGVSGYSCDTGTLGCGDLVGVFGSSLTGLGIWGCSGGKLIGKFKNRASSGDRTALVQFETGDTTVADWNAGVAGSCNSLSVPDRSFYVQYANPCTNPPAFIINKCGQVGIGKPIVPVGSCCASMLSVVAPANDKLCAAVYGQNCIVLGCCCGAAGVFGVVPATGGVGIGGLFKSNSKKGIGVEGIAAATAGPASGGLFESASINGIGAQGLATASGGIGVEGVAGNAGAIPIVAKGASGQTANLQQWEKNCGAALSVVNNNGWLGVGTLNPSTTLQVNGSVSAKLATVTSKYTMVATDFAIVANASSAGFTVTLPVAKTAAGMMVHVKKIDSTTNVVTVSASGTDKIEGASSKGLSKKFASLTLISDGASNWYIISNAT